ncbi:hypothetical protein V519_034960 [Streptomyces rimosus R6-500]|nr:hypothetical protein V519_034960 [Streptomyces rimosus R6-500]
MSTEAVTWAMDDAPMLRTKSGKPDTTARHVLQALAEHANKNGRNAHPSLIRLQYRTGYDRRTVQRALRRLQDAGLIVDDGRVQDRTRWKLALHVTRPASDWEDLERAEEEDREATAARVRKHRSKKSAVTDAEAVTETDADDVTEAGVTDSASVRNALEVRYVTHSASVCNALSAALTTNQPSEEPPATPMAGVGAQGAGPCPARTTPPSTTPHSPSPTRCAAGPTPPTPGSTSSTPLPSSSATTAPPEHAATPGPMPGKSGYATTPAASPNATPPETSSHCPPARPSPEPTHA